MRRQVYLEGHRIEFDPFEGRNQSLKLLLYLYPYRTLLALSPLFCMPWVEGPPLSLRVVGNVCIGLFFPPFCRIVSILVGVVETNVWVYCTTPTVWSEQSIFYSISQVELLMRSR